LEERDQECHHYLWPVAPLKNVAERMFHLQAKFKSVAAQKHHSNGSIGVMEGNTFNKHTTSSTEEESKPSSTILFSMDVRI
jgi:hypothetical protein